MSEREFTKRQKIKRLERWKFREIKIPSVTLWLIMVGLVLGLQGAAFNFRVVSTNHGLMPVLDDIIYNSTTHFTITNVSEVNNLHLADIYYWKGGIWSIGDILMTIGFSMFILAHIIRLYNFIINYKIQRVKTK